MSHTRVDSRNSGKWCWLPCAALSLLLAGCATLPDGSKTITTKAATLQAAVPPSYPVTKEGAREITCTIQMIDGNMVSSSDRLLPGHHRLVVGFGGTEGEFSGDVDLVIPAAKTYRLMAEKEEDTFTLALVEQDTAKVVATSSAPIAPMMEFQVFVIQK